MTTLLERMVEAAEEIDGFFTRLTAEQSRIDRVRGSAELVSYDPQLAEWDEAISRHDRRN